MYFYIRSHEFTLVHVAFRNFYNINYLKYKGFRRNKGTYSFDVPTKHDINQIKASVSQNIKELIK